MDRGFGRKLKYIREQNKLTLRELSKGVGIPASTLGSWERGTAFPKNYDNVYKLALYFDVKPQYLYGGTM